MKTSKTQKVIDWLNSYGAITSMEAYNNFSLTRLASVIHNLKKHGYNITTEIIENNHIRYARYHLVR